MEFRKYAIAAARGTHECMIRATVAIALDVLEAQHKEEAGPRASRKALHQALLEQGINPNTAKVIGTVGFRLAARLAAFGRGTRGVMGYLNQVPEQAVADVIAFIRADMPHEHSENFSWTSLRAFAELPGVGPTAPKDIPAPETRADEDLKRFLRKYAPNVKIACLRGWVTAIEAAINEKEKKHDKRDKPKPPHPEQTQQTASSG